MRLAIIVPVLNQASSIEATLRRLAPLRARGARLIVVDGGSQDGTVQAAAPLADRVLASARGRALQMNAGARDHLAQEVDALLFLRPDTLLPPLADVAILRALSNLPRPWGCFNLAIAGADPRLAWIARLINGRARLTGLCSGEQAIFVTRAAFSALEGFAPIPLLEDDEFSRRARLLSPPIVLRQRVLISGRRFERDGPWRTLWSLGRLRLAFLLGADPADLARRQRR